MRTFRAGIAACALFLASQAFGQELLDEDILGAQAASFKVFDADQDGKATAAEVAAGAKSIFAALDPDGDGAVTQNEFGEFSMGFAPLAEQLLRRDEYRAARNVIFTRWDMNADTQLSQAEITAALLEEVYTASEAAADQEAYAKSRFIAEMGAALR